MRLFSVSSDTGAPVQCWWPKPGGILPVDHLLLQGIYDTVESPKFDILMSRGYISSSKIIGR